MDNIKKVLEKEILDKSQFVEECKETEDLRNASYWKAFVHGVKFSLDVIDDHLTSRRSRAADAQTDDKPSKID